MLHPFIGATVSASRSSLSNDLPTLSTVVVAPGYVSVHDTILETNHVAVEGSTEIPRSYAKLKSDAVNSILTKLRTGDEVVTVMQGACGSGKTTMMLGWNTERPLHAAAVGSDNGQLPDDSITSNNSNSTASSSSILQDVVRNLFALADSDPDVMVSVALGVIEHRYNPNNSARKRPSNGVGEDDAYTSDGNDDGDDDDDDDDDPILRSTESVDLLTGHVDHATATRCFAQNISDLPLSRYVICNHKRAFERVLFDALEKSVSWETANKKESPALEIPDNRDARLVEEGIDDEVEKKKKKKGRRDSLHHHHHRQQPRQLLQAKRGGESHLNINLLVRLSSTSSPRSAHSVVSVWRIFDLAGPRVGHLDYTPGSILSSSTHQFICRSLLGSTGSREKEDRSGRQQAPIALDAVGSLVVACVLGKFAHLVWIAALRFDSEFDGINEDCLRVANVVAKNCNRMVVPATAGGDAQRNPFVKGCLMREKHLHVAGSILEVHGVPFERFCAAVGSSSRGAVGPARSESRQPTDGDGPGSGPPGGRSPFVPSILLDDGGSNHNVSIDTVSVATTGASAEPPRRGGARYSSASSAPNSPPAAPLQTPKLLDEDLRPAREGTRGIGDAVAVTGGDDGSSQRLNLAAIAASAVAAALRRSRHVDAATESVPIRPRNDERRAEAAVVAPREPSPVAEGTAAPQPQNKVPTRNTGTTTDLPLFTVVAAPSSPTRQQNNSTKRDEAVIEALRAEVSRLRGEVEHLRSSAEDSVNLVAKMVEPTINQFEKEACKLKAKVLQQQDSDRELMDMLVQHMRESTDEPPGGHPQYARSHNTSYATQQLGDRSHHTSSNYSVQFAESTAKKIRFLETQIVRLHRENLSLKRDLVDTSRSTNVTDSFRKILNESGALFNKHKVKLERTMQSLHDERAKVESMQRETLRLQEELTRSRGMEESLRQTVATLQKQNSRMSKQLQSKTSISAVSALLTHASATVGGGEQWGGGKGGMGLFEAHVTTDDDGDGGDDQVKRGYNSSSSSRAGPMNEGTSNVDMLPTFQAAVDRVVSACLVPLAEAEETFKTIMQEGPPEVSRKAKLGVAQMAERRQHLLVLVDCLKDETQRVQRELLEAAMRERQYLNTLISRH